ncbi:LPS export ABC transporter periplasmic protein LptC [Laspinema olomoucense]|uniref:LPS export ABC transporter periplasmic protein LptC n=1 Tax=Laspinema olomoucense D3b TaxID=2953688 RepID=A0ABT2NDM3_9CYAN|nr:MULTISPECIES: LPS export ABC transporter periplasmic protein LptC [unclassified Laspinema]MCT7980801.1 LPS export ABC transporter periplasmic protein LptC [Laspinema sp. D3b]MCT7989267.1 LPS export ABC transporter periplasmic protein LptC [Laspinema sp. D3a]
MKNSGFFLLFLYALLGLGLPSCSFFKKGDTPVGTEGEEGQDQALTFNDVTLEQANAEGEIVWKVRSPSARYNDEQKITYLETPTGELFQEGQLVYKIQSKTGQVHGDGSKIVLQDQIVATELQNQAVLRAQELEWLPGQDLLIVRNNVSGTHPDLQITANEARLKSQAQRMELLGNVVATTQKNPAALQMRSEAVVWQMETDQIISDRPVQIDRYLCENPQNCPASDKAVGDRGELNLETNVVTLEQEVQITLSKPPLTINSDLMRWNIDAQNVTSERRVTIVHPKQTLTLMGDRGTLELASSIISLVGNVSGVRDRPSSEFKADRMTWVIPTEEFQAEGNVFYRQANPPFTVTGPKAVGKLQNQSIVVTGGDVVTDVIP